MTPGESVPMIATEATTTKLSYLSLCLVTILFSTVACNSELDPSDPEDAYDIFRHALFEGDGEKVWARTDEQTREYFEQRHEVLQEMNALIERYLPHTDHQIARSQSGAELLDEIESGEELFVRLFEPVEFPDNHAIRFGAEVQQIQMAEDGETAVVLTRSEQEFVIVRQDDENWYVNLAESGDFLDNTFQWLIENEDALTQTVEDLIAEERQVREQIIADLMDIDDE